MTLRDRSGLRVIQTSSRRGFLRLAALLGADTTASGLACCVGASGIVAGTDAAASDDGCAAVGADGLMPASDGSAAEHTLTLLQGAHPLCVEGAGSQGLWPKRR